MRILLFGGSGMLGQAVSQQVFFQGNHILKAPAHEECPIEDWKSVRGLAESYRPDVIINCAGALPGSSPLEMIKSNAFGPRNLEALGIRFVHMSTDCVFSGKGKDYIPWYQDHDPVDFYGASKALGEPTAKHTLTVRGSFIGQKHGFLRWLLDARGEVDAWDNAYWNGGSVENMAAALIDRAESGHIGVAHVASAKFFSKAAMIEHLAQRLSLPIEIRHRKEPHIMRALQPNILLPPIGETLDEIAEQCLASSSH